MDDPAAELEAFTRAALVPRSRLTPGLHDALVSRVFAPDAELRHPFVHARGVRQIASAYAALSWLTTRRDVTIHRVVADVPGRAVVVDVTQTFDAIPCVPWQWLTQSVRVTATFHLTPVPAPVSRPLTAESAAASSATANASNSGSAWDSRRPKELRAAPAGSAMDSPLSTPTPTSTVLRARHLHQRLPHPHRRTASLPHAAEAEGAAADSGAPQHPPESASEPHEPPPTPASPPASPFSPPSVYARFDATASASAGANRRVSLETAPPLPLSAAAAAGATAHNTVPLTPSRPVPAPEPPTRWLVAVQYDSVDFGSLLSSAPLVGRLYDASRRLYAIGLDLSLRAFECCAVRAEAWRSAAAASAEHFCRLLCLRCACCVCHRKREPSPPPTTVRN